MMWQMQDRLLMDPLDIARLEEMLDYRFIDGNLLIQAMTHSSLADHRLESNERLEFLGDAILGMVVCENLFRTFQQDLEGELTKIKSTVVSRHTCADVAKEMGLGELIQLGKGMTNRHELPGSVLAATFEALIGAIFLDGGLEVSRSFILSHLEPHINRAAESGHQSNFKSVLQQTVQQVLDLVPQYQVLDEQGPDHAKCFEVCVELAGRRFDSSWGSSKKQAEQQAALNALMELGYALKDDDGQVRIRHIDELLADHKTNIASS